MTRVAPLLALALMFGYAPSADAQIRRMLGLDAPSGRGFFMIGVQQMDLAELNDRFDAADYPESDDLFLTLGGGGFMLRDRLVIGGEGHGVIGSSETTGDGAFRTRVGGGFGMIDIGYAVMERRGLLVYPMLGVGMGGMMVSINERSSPDFDDVLDQPRRGVNLVQGQFLLSAGLGIDHVFASRGRGGFAVGIRAGWTFTPIEHEWSFGSSDVADGPKAGFTGPYVRVNVGGGRR